MYVHAHMQGTHQDKYAHKFTPCIKVHTKVAIPTNMKLLKCMHIYIHAIVSITLGSSMMNLHHGKPSSLITHAESGNHLSCIPHSPDLQRELLAPKHSQSHILRYLQEFLSYFYIFCSHLAVLSYNSWLCSQGPLLEGSGDDVGTESKRDSCQTDALPSILWLWP